VWFERGRDVQEDEVARLPRVGIDYAGEDAALPWRFVWRQP
jgi:DNA-3-methyladenine glycosylase